MFFEVNFLFEREHFFLQASLCCEKGKILGIDAPMGAGKSSFFQCLVGILHPVQGQIILGQNILFERDIGKSRPSIFTPPHKRKIGCLFQEDRIFDHLSVEENLFYASSPSFSETTREEILELLNLKSLLKQRSSSLSGGEKRRLAIGRVLFSDFQLLLLDEPFRSLEQGMIQSIVSYLKSRKDITIFFASHNKDIFQELAEETISIQDGILASSHK